jgi:very-short-patch-repair endonuclease
MEAPARTRWFAKRLRRRMSLPEAVLWRNLKARQLAGLHFRKQHPLGAYVLDFYCDERKLCIEVDGAFHGTEDRPERDARRDSWLQKSGVRILRLRAGLVLSDMDTALRMILHAAQNPEPDAQPPGPPPLGEVARRAGGG